jgi:hypothetical protein
MGVRKTSTAGARHAMRVFENDREQNGGPGDLDF